MSLPKTGGSWPTLAEDLPYKLQVHMNNNFFLESIYVLKNLLNNYKYFIVNLVIIVY